MSVRCGRQGVNEVIQLYDKQFVMEYAGSEMCLTCNTVMSHFYPFCLNPKHIICIIITFQIWVSLIATHAGLTRKWKLTLTL